MNKYIEFEPAFEVQWVVSPLQESPYVEFFDLWCEIEDWITHMENTCEAFDLEYVCIIDLTREG